MSILKRIPVPVAAVALALATLGNLLATYSPALKTACGAISGLLVISLLARVALDMPGVKAELGNPAALAIAPALPMALMVLSTYLKPVIGQAAFALWAAALLIQAAIMVLFITRHVVRLVPATILPSWFIVLVGFVVAAVTSPAFALEPLGSVLVWIGLAGYAAGLGLLAYRFAKVGDLPAPAAPTVAILIAPPSLCLAAYLAVAPAKQPVVIYALLAAMAISLVYVLVKLPGILRAGFQPTWAALTFPFAITAVAFKLSAGFFAKTGTGTAIPPVAVQAFELLAVALVLLVLVRYVMHVAKAPAA